MKNIGLAHHLTHSLHANVGSGGGASIYIYIIDIELAYNYKEM